MLEHVLTTFKGPEGPLNVVNALDSYCSVPSVAWYVAPPLGESGRSTRPSSVRLSGSVTYFAFSRVFYSLSFAVRVFSQTRFVVPLYWRFLSIHKYKYHITIFYNLFLKSSISSHNRISEGREFHKVAP